MKLVKVYRTIEEIKLDECADQAAAVMVRGGRVVLIVPRAVPR